MLQSVLESDSMFGVIKWDPTTKSMANVGCCAQIIKHHTAEDGRSNIITLGQQRFQVLGNYAFNTILFSDGKLD